VKSTGYSFEGEEQDTLEDKTFSFSVSDFLDEESLPKATNIGSNNPKDMSKNYITLFYWINLIPCTIPFYSFNSVRLLPFKKNVSI